MYDSVKVQGGGCGGGIVGDRRFFIPPPTLFFFFFLTAGSGEASSSAPGSVFQSMTVTVDRFCSLAGLLSQADDLKGLVGVFLCVWGGRQ